MNEEKNLHIAISEMLENLPGMEQHKILEQVREKLENAWGERRALAAKQLEEVNAQKEDFLYGDRPKDEQEKVY